jgi:hypothetical protein
VTRNKTPAPTLLWVSLNEKRWGNLSERYREKEKKELNVPRCQKKRGGGKEEKIKVKEKSQ